MSARSAVMLAQAILGGAGAKITQDGVLGPETVNAYAFASPAIRDQVRESVSFNEGMDWDDMIWNYRRRRGQIPPPVMTSKVDLTKPAMIGSIGSGWEGRVRSRMAAAGVPQAGLNAVVNQVRKETSGRLRVTEDHRYDPTWLRSKMRVFRDVSPADIKKLQDRGPEAFFNFAYGDRKDLGNRGRASGDGYRYRGRGALQLTGRSNYERAGKVLGVDLLNDPDWVVRTEDNAVASAVAFLKMNGKLNVALNNAQMAKLVNPHLA